MARTAVPRRGSPSALRNLFKLLFALTFIALLTTTARSADHVETVVQFDAAAGELTEGVTVDSRGNVFVSLTPLGQIVKVSAGSTVARPFASVEGLQEGDLGMLGLAVDADDHVYATVVSANTEVNGVWRFDKETGAGEHIAGSEAIGFPNSIIFDQRGVMYVTGTADGAVWYRNADGEIAPWSADPLLAGDGSAGFDVPLGANGIAELFGYIYVGVTETALIVKVPINDDGSAGEATLHSEVGAPVDGIAINQDGVIYVAGVLTNNILRVATDGSVETVLEGNENGLDAPSSVALGPEEGDMQALYAVNFSVAVAPPGGPGPALLRLMVPAAVDDGSEPPIEMPETGASLTGPQISWPLVATLVILFGGVGFAVVRRRRLQI